MDPDYSHEQSQLIGVSDPFHLVLEQTSSLAVLDRPVLIIGERGSGKEMIAARLHYLSERWEKPYIKLNCATLNESLLESALFGYEPGAFTGAQKIHKGLFERAHQGSLFLDELAAMSLRLQEKVLRTIEYGELERLGGDRTVRVHCRIIAASNEDLPAKAAAGQFRADLLDRLSFEVLTLPPLRARKEDILLLADHFALKMTRELKRDYFVGFAPKAKADLLAYEWPGNVRELKNVVERSVYRHEDKEKLLERIIFNPFASPYRPRQAGSESGSWPASQKSQKQKLSSHSTKNAGQALTFSDQIKQLEIKLIKESLMVNQHNRRRAALSLGLSYDQLRGLMRKHQIKGCDTLTP